MDKIKLIQALQQDKAGFTHITIEAERVLRELSAAKCMELAKELYNSDIYQNRMFAVMVMGALAVMHKAAYSFLTTKAITDENWRVQEMLARAFNQYCKEQGYEKSLPVVQEWLHASHANQRRAASEGLRVWTSRPYFKDHPAIAISLLGGLKADQSEYVRKSVGNALRDISKQFPKLIKGELATWNLANQQVAHTHKLATRSQ